MKKRIFNTIIIIFVLLLSVGCDDKEKEVKLKDNLTFEINSDLSLYSLISDDNEVEILSENKRVDTSKLGEKEISLKFKINNEEYEGSFKINIVDTIQPVILYNNKISITEGETIDLIKDVRVTDNSEETIVPTVEGTYDFNKEGIYNLKYIAIDSSNNKAEANFTLEVKKKEEPTTNDETYNNNSNNNNNSNKTTTKTNTNTTYKAIGSSKVYYGNYKLEADTEEFKGTLTLKSNGTVSTSGYTYINGRLVKKNLTGTWTLKAKTISGIYGGKVDGIYFTWSDGSKTTFGIYNKFFGNNEVDYKWVSK